MLNNKYGADLRKEKEKKKGRKKEKKKKRNSMPRDA